MNKGAVWYMAGAHDTNFGGSSNKPPLIVTIILASGQNWEIHSLEQAELPLRWSTAIKSSPIFDLLIIE